MHHVFFDYFLFLLFLVALLTTIINIITVFLSHSNARISSFAFHSIHVLRCWNDACCVFCTNHSGFGHSCVACRFHCCQGGEAVVSVAEDTSPDIIFVDFDRTLCSTKVIVIAVLTTLFFSLS